MKTYSNRFYALTVTLILPLFLLVSCGSDKSQVIYPEPAENPLYLSVDAQTKDVWVKQMNMIGSLNNKDIITENMDQAETGGLWRQIKYDWVTVKFGDEVPKEVVRITVEENTTVKDRTFEFVVLNGGWTKKLTIIQAGKS